MEEINQEPILASNLPNCSNCTKEITEEATFCNSCGFPERGTDSEKAKFHAKKAMKKNQHMDAGKKVQSARTTLFVIGGLTLIMGFVYYAMQDDIAILVTNLILAAIYGALGFWSNTKPLAAILSGVLLYITILVINGIVEPESIYKGIILKIIVISYLGKGLYSAREAQKQMQQTPNE